MNIVDTTALNVLCRTSATGTTESDFFHSKVYWPKYSIERLLDQGYRIQTRSVVTPSGKEMCWFINLDHAKELAVTRKQGAMTHA